VLFRSGFAVLLSFIKNLKQIGVSQVVSATLVVQGVAVQQSAVNDFSQQEAIVQELNHQANNQNQLSNESTGQQEQYWESIESVIELADSKKSEVSSEVSAVADAFEEIIADSAMESSKASASSSGNLISGVSVAPSASSSPTASKPSQSPSVSPSSSGPSGAARGPAAASGVNGVPKPSEEPVSEKAEEVINSPVSSTEVPVVAPENNSVAEEPSESEVKPEPTPEPVNEFDAYLGEVNLYRENVLVQEISNGDEISVQDSNNFEIQIEENSDIGSLHFILTDQNTNQVVHNQSENLPPFQLGGGNGIPIPAGSYSLLIQLYDNDSFSGEAKAERVISFNIANPSWSTPLDNNLALYKNGSFEAYISDGDTLYLNRSDDYNIQVESLSDFGSVNIDLNATNTRSSGGGQENNLPYQLTNNPNGFDFETANYDLTVIAYPSNGQSDAPLQELSINFDVIVQ
jgi:hypothetical protein